MKWKLIHERKNIIKWLKIKRKKKHETTNGNELEFFLWDILRYESIDSAFVSNKFV